MKKILITGAAGNIGSALADRLLSHKEFEVVGVDNFLTGSVSKLPPAETTNFSFIKANVNNFREISSIMTSCRFDYVFIMPLWWALNAHSTTRRSYSMIFRESKTFSTSLRIPA